MEDDYFRIKGKEPQGFREHLAEFKFLHKPFWKGMIEA